MDIKSKSKITIKSSDRAIKRSVLLASLTRAICSSVFTVHELTTRRLSLQNRKRHKNLRLNTQIIENSAAQSDGLRRSQNCTAPFYEATPIQVKYQVLGEPNVSLPLWTVYTFTGRQQDCNLQYKFNKQSETLQVSTRQIQSEPSIPPCSPPEPFLPSGVHELQVRDLFWIYNNVK